MEKPSAAKKVAIWMSLQYERPGLAQALHTGAEDERIVQREPNGGAG